MRILLLALVLAVHALTPKLAWTVESDEVFEAELDYYKCLIAASYGAKTRKDISELYEKGDSHATIEIMRIVLNECQHSANALVRIGGAAGESLRKEQYNAAFDVIEQEVRINFQARYRKEVAPSLRDYEGCMYSAAQEYCPSNSTAFEIAEAAAGKCASEFSEMEKASENFRASFSLPVTNAYTKTSEDAFMRKFRDKIKDKVIQQIVECRMQPTLKPVPKIVQ